MTWAKNYGDRNATSGSGDTRAKAVERVCARCGTGIGTKGGKKFCGPCRDIRYGETVATNRAKGRTAKQGSK